ncbi:reverse transcriptase domain-containing protein [Tanacetum coccineum]
MLTIILIGSSASLACLIIPESLKTQSYFEFFPHSYWSRKKMGAQTSPKNYQYLGSTQEGHYPKAWERYNDLLYKCPTHDINSHQKKWHDGSTSRNIGSSSSNDGLAALVNKLDNLGRDMKKLKESVHAIQIGCQICEGPHLDKDCPLNKEVKQVEEIDNRPPYGENLEELLAKHQEESARRSTEIEVWIKKLQENAEINTRNQSSLLKNLETHIEQLTKEIRSDKTLDSSSEKIKPITADQETFWLNKLHGVSFISDLKSDATEVLQHQLPGKELNPGNFTLPCTIGKFNFYAMADLGASINVMPMSIFEHLHLTNLRKTNMLCEMADMSKKAPLGIVKNVLVKIGNFLFLSNFVIIDNTPSETTILGRPFLATICTEIDVFVGKISLGINEDRISFDSMIDSKWDNRSPNLDDREAKKRKIELDKNVPRAHFCSPIKQNIKEQTKMWPSCDPDKKMCNGGVEICVVSKIGNLKFWYCNYDNERRDINGKGLSFPDFLLTKYGKSQTDSEASSQKSNKPRPRDYTFREWTLIKVGHTDISDDKHN